ncbi:MAG: hypothetical protein KGY42_08360 [Desulfobacterales bacterium]|nr:hypothetical protein [Desulfobacterales bacterium]MBS3755419.1 hypothetical protein [Desulfobacterales bacterium]
MKTFAPVTPGLFGTFEFGSLGIVSDFGFRASDLWLKDIKGLTEFPMASPEDKISTTEYKGGMKNGKAEFWRCRGRSHHIR